MIASRQISRTGLGLLAVLGALALAGPASAADAPSLSLTSLATPTNFKPGDATTDYTYDLRVANLGGAATDGSEITVTDTLPVGLEVKSVEMILRTSAFGVDHSDYGEDFCTVDKPAAAEVVTCTISEAIPGAVEAALMQPGEERRIVIHVVPNAVSEGETLSNHVSVEGGGSAPAEIDADNEASAQPSSGGISFFNARLSESDGSASAQAASHPYQFTVGFAVDTKPGPPGAAPFVPAGGDIKDLSFTLPPGLVGNANATTRCTAQQFATTHTITFGGPFFTGNDCPDSSAIGMILVQQIEGNPGIAPVPLYNLVPSPGMPAQFGAQILNLPFFINTEVRPDDNYKIVATLRNLTQVKRLTAATSIIWGTPADPSHDGLRGVCINQLEYFPITSPYCEPQEGEGVEQKPFLRLPTSCASPLDVLMGFDNWTQPGQFLAATAGGPVPGGCEQVEFDPTLQARPTTDRADSPSGLRVNLHIPQKEHEEPEELGQADLKDITVEFPPGLVINPSGANGLDACTPTQITLDSPAAASCPPASRIGNVEVNTPLLDHPIKGGVFVASPYANPFNSLLAVYLAVADPVSGVVVKLAGKVTPNLVTGQLSSTFSENPQTPFEDFKLEFFGGAGAALRTPQVCGTYSTTWSMTPWSAPASGPPDSGSDSYAISRAPAGGPCATSAAALPFAPAFNADAIAPISKTYTPFVIHLRREDGSQEFASVSLTPPPGLIAKLAGVPYCPEAALAAAATKSGNAEKAAPSCPAASQVGTVNVGAGAGPAPFYTQGTAYLAGPYKGAPLSLAIITPAAAGPYDLGTVVVRTALQVDPETARITANSDPIPRILQGIPLDVRTIAVKLDRPNFALTPTSCDEMAVTGTAASTLGKSAALFNRFQVGECKRLKFAPKLSLNLKGPTKRTGHPRLRAVLTYPKKGEYANIARASVALPHSEFLDQAHIRTVCTRVQFAAAACPKGAIYGYAEAITPILDKPLKGPVYLRSSSNPLPDVVADLHGQLHVALVGRIDSVNGGIRTRFESVPDAPVSKFIFTLYGGKKGLLVNSRNICAHTNRAKVSFEAHNGKVADMNPALRAQCPGKGGKKK